MIEVKPITYGVACRIGNTIFLNKELEKDIKLYLAILNHELKHSSGFSIKDIGIDIKNEDLRGLKKRYYKFILTHPSSWIEFLPAWKYEGKLVINPSILMLYGLFLALLGGILLLI